MDVGMMTQWGAFLRRHLLRRRAPTSQRALIKGPRAQRVRGSRRARFPVIGIAPAAEPTITRRTWCASHAIMGLVRLRVNGCKVDTGGSLSFTCCPGVSLSESGQGPFCWYRACCLWAALPALLSFFACWGLFSSPLAGRFSSRLWHGCLGSPGRLGTNAAGGGSSGCLSGAAWGASLWW